VGVEHFRYCRPILYASRPKPETTTFEALIRRVRAWDQEAAAELVRRYEPAIRRAVRFGILRQL
jgi:hypothetical protein